MSSGWVNVIVGAVALLVGFLFSRLREARAAGREAGQVENRLSSLKESVEVCERRIDAHGTELERLSSCLLAEAAKLTSLITDLRLHLEEELKPLTRGVDAHAHQFQLYDEKLGNVQTHVGTAIDNLQEQVRQLGGRYEKIDEQLGKMRDALTRIEAKQSA